MSNSTTRPRPRWRMFAIVGLIAACVCSMIIFGALSLFTLGQETSSAEPTNFPNMSAATPTPRVVGAIATNVSATREPQQTAVPTAVTVEIATGALRFEYPITLNLDKEEIITLEIVPDQPVALVGNSPRAPAARLLVETSPSDAPRKTISYTIPLYPAMSAELDTASTDLNIAEGSETKQRINPFDKNFWTWSLVARRGGEYRVTLRVFGFAELEDDAPLKQVVSDTRLVRANERPFLERVAQGLAENWLVIFGAGGPLALILTILTLWLARRDRARTKS